MSGGTILSFVTPWRFNTVLFGVYDYLLPLMLYCAWSTVALVDLAERAETDRPLATRWAAAILLLPVVGAAGYLLAGRSTLSRVSRHASLLGGLGLVAAAYALTYYRIR